MTILIRKTKKSTSIRRRFMSFSSNELVVLTKIKYLMILTITDREMAKTDVDIERNRNMFDSLVIEYFQLLLDDYGKLPRPIRKKISLDDLDPSFCKEFLTFNKLELIKLYQIMNFPNKVKFSNGSAMTGEELFIRGLYELSTGEKKTSIANTFGRHYTDQSRAFQYFINFIYVRYHHLVDNNLDWWFRSGLIAVSAKLIENKMNLESGIMNLFALFIDCNCLETSVPGGGPAELGANAARWEPDVQRSFYNGWKSIHGLKHQTVDCAMGLTVDISMDLRHYDEMIRYY
uniref:Uncharacterized protein n=1 Tax=Chromulina nebulosa TaxID=96789 RepID=A0A6T5VGP0_9STRA|mmetsp:Transcript_257/g.223  ORF Transcript_257/g.223 Transcript_257/m.223 type:complete len:289 (+) Transcript_257:5-871(+)